MDKTILIIGGTGMLGKPVALQLKKDGFKVKILSRDVKKARIKLPSNFDLIEGDVRDSKSLNRALEGCYGVHINLQGGPKDKDFDDVEHQGTVNIVNAALIQGIQKITYISGSSVDKSHTYFAPTRAKYYAEEAIINSNIPFTIFRPSWFMESLPQFIRNGKAMVIGNNKNGYHWLAAADFAELVSKAYQLSDMDFDTIKVYGPEKYTIHQALKKYCEIKHSDIKPSIVPLGVFKIISFLSFDARMKFMAALFQYFEKVGEEENKTYYISNMLNKDAITLVKWSKEYSLL